MGRSFPDFMAVPPGEVLIVTDYGGTIAPIVTDPSHALPVSKVVELLAALAPLVGGVAVLSARSERSLRSFLPVPGVRLIGENGIEALTPDERATFETSRSERPSPSPAGPAW